MGMGMGMGITPSLYRSGNFYLVLEKWAVVDDFWYKGKEESGDL